jgi:hypothetical protein
VRSRGALGAGLAVAALYLLAAVVSGSLSPLARRPVLDGFAPPPPYRWISPPPDLAPSNERPAAGSFSLALHPQTGSEAKVLATSDVQVSLAVALGTFPPAAGKDSVKVSIRPLAPSSAADSPPGYAFSGNVYQIQAAYSPGGPAVRTLRKPGQLTLFYPPALDNLVHRHALLRSSDGVTWQVAPATDSLAQQQVTGNVSSLGFFAAGESQTGHAKPFPIGKVIYYSLLAVVVGTLAAMLLVSEARARRKKRRAPPRRRKRR